jgi:hypothetical protein
MLIYPLKSDLYYPYLESRVELSEEEGEIYILNEQFIKREPGK